MCCILCGDNTSAVCILCVALTQWKLLIAQYSWTSVKYTVYRVLHTMWRKYQCSVPTVCGAYPWKLFIALTYGICKVYSLLCAAYCLETIPVHCAYCVWPLPMPILVALTHGHLYSIQYSVQYVYQFAAYCVDTIPVQCVWRLPMETTTTSA